MDFLFAVFRPEYLLAESVTFLCLSAGVVSGLFVLERHCEQFSTFRVPDVLRLELHAMFYMAVSFSTALCLIDIVIQIVFLMTVGWKSDIMVWRVILLLLCIVHVGFGLVSTLIHVMVDSLLSHTATCDTCDGYCGTRKVYEIE